jgi:hypothetical protein
LVDALAVVAAAVRTGIAGRATVLARDLVVVAALEAKAFRAPDLPAAGNFLRVVFATEPLAPF